MVSAKDLVSNLFHGIATMNDVVKNFQVLCLNHLKYQHVNDFRRFYQDLSFGYTVLFNDSEYSQKRFGYVVAKDYAHFAKPLILGFGKKEGLIAEMNLEGQLNSPDVKEIEKLDVKELKMHGYGKLWNVSQTKSQLSENTCKRLQIPNCSMVKELSEEYMIKAIKDL